MSPETLRGREAASVLAIAGVLADVPDLTEALRRVCRELARLTGAETVSAHLLSGEGMLRPAAAYHVPLEMLTELSTTPLSIDALPFAPGVVSRQVVVWSDEVPTDPRFEHPLFRRHGHQSGVVVPLTIDDGLVGAFYLVWWRERRRPVETELSALQAIAQQVGLLLRNVKLREEAEQRRRTAEALSRMAQSLAESLEPSEVARRIVSGLMALLHVAGAGVYRLDPGTGDMLPLAVFAPDAASADVEQFASDPVPAGAGAVGLAVRERRPVVSPDVATDPRLIFPEGWRARVAAVGFAARLTAPLLVHDRVIGALIVGAETGRTFNEEEIGLVQAFAAQAAIALENARLHAETERRRQSAESLAEIGRLVTQSLDFREVGQRIVSNVLRLLGGTAAVLYEEDRISGDLVLVTGVGAGVDWDQRPARGAAVVGRAIEERRAVMTSDLLSDPSITIEPAVRRRMERAGYPAAVLAVPLVARDEAVGVLAVGDNAGRIFTAEEIALTCVFADQAAIALVNARRYEFAERQRRRAMELTADLAGGVSAALKLDTVLSRIVEGARELTQGDFAMIGLREADTGSVVMGHSSGLQLPAQAPRRIEPGQGVAGIVLETGRPFRTENYVEDARLASGFRAQAQAEGLSAMMAAPILLGQEVEGVVVVGRRGTHRFTDQDEEALMQLAAAAALALGNSRLTAAATVARRDTDAAMRALEASERRYRELVESSIQGILIHRDFVIQFANTAAARMTGYDDPAEMVGLDMRTLITLGEVARAEANNARVQQGEVLAPTEYEGRRRDGTPLWVEIQRTIMQWDGAAAVLVAVVDVTERRAAALALQERDEQLRQAQKMEAVGQLAGGIAHDFNNLLTAIGMRAEMLASGLSEASPERDGLEMILSAAERAAGLTRQLLAFSRKQVLQPTVFELNVMIEGLVTMLGRLIGENVELMTSLDPGAGSVRADRGQIEQVVLNLIVNARDAMPRGGRLRITTGAAPPWVTLTVRDTGVGMSEEVQARIFEPFFTTRAADGGTGLGLSTVYGIVSQHQGEISVQSAPGKGATFVVRLPRAAGQTPAATVTPETRAGSGTVLLVEDHDDVREVVAQMLKQYGYDVVKAANAKAAKGLADARGEPFDLLVTDVIMPGMGGPELAAYLKEKSPGLRVLYMSGYTDNALGPYGVLDHDVRLIQKPFTSAAFLRVVADVLSRPASG